MNILLAGVFFSGCDTDESEPDFGMSVITKVDGPTSGSVSQEITLQVTLQGNNSCAVRGELTETAGGNTRVIMGKVVHESVSCFPVLTSVLANYTFKTAAKGTYELRFVKADNTFITHVINVQ